MLIEPTTALAERNVLIKHGQSVCVRGTLVAEVIAIEIPDGAGGWMQLYEEGGAVQLSSTNHQISAIGNTLIRISKPSTTNSVGVAIV